MARLALPLAGLAIGAAIPGIGASYGFLAGNLLGNLFQPTVRGPSIEETGAQTTQEGAPRAIVYGTAMVSGNVIDAGRTRKITRKQRQGKGGPSVETEALLRTYAIRIAEPIAGIIMAKKDGKIVYDARDPDFQDDNDKFLAGCRIYKGDEEQLPDPDLEAIHGAGEVPAYRGSSYIVFIDDDVTDRRGSIPQYEFVVGRAEANRLGNPGDPIPSESRYVIQGSTGGGGLDSSRIPGLTMDSSVNDTYFIGWYVEPTFGQPAVTATFYIEINGSEVYEFTGDASEGNRLYHCIQFRHKTRSDFCVVGMRCTPSSSGQFYLSWQAINSSKVYTPVNPADVVFPNDPLYGLFLDGEDKLFTMHMDVPQFPPEWSWGADVLTEEAVEAGGTTVKISPVPLHEIVTSISERCNVSPDNYDTSELVDMVDGFVMASAGYSGADAINSLRAPYFFDCPEYGGKIWYHKRGKASVAEITMSDMVEEPDDSERQAQIEYPRKLHLTFQSAAVNYQTAQATSERLSPDVRVTGESAMQVAVVMTPELAAQKAAMLHKVSWSEAEGEVKFSLPDSWLRLVPGDCVVLKPRDTARRIRIDGIEMSAGVMQITGHVDRRSAYASTVGYVPLPEPTKPPSSVVGDTVLAVLDVPLLQDDDDALYYYAAVTGDRSAWRGAQVQRSLDGGASYADALGISFPATMGRLRAELSEASPWYTDTTNVIDVDLIRDGDSMDSVTAAQFLQRGGAVALQLADGSWEVAQYRDAEHVSGLRYRLSTLHRGQLNTVPGAHAAGAMLVLLDDVSRISAQSAWLRRVLTHRAPSFGGAVETATPQSITYAGRAQREWPVASLRIVQTQGGPVGGNIAVNWAPRHRLGTDVAPVASQHFRGFRVYVTDAAGQNSTQDVATPSATLQLGMMTWPIRVHVAAVNAITGAGPWRWISTEGSSGEGDGPPDEDSGGETPVGDGSFQRGIAMYGSARAGAYGQLMGSDLYAAQNNGTSWQLFRLNPDTLEVIRAAYAGPFLFTVINDGANLYGGSDGLVRKWDADLNETAQAQVGFTGDAQGLALCGGSLWVSVPYEPAIKKLDPATLAVQATVTGLRINSLVTDGTYLYGASRGDNCIYKLDGSTGSLVETFPTAGFPADLVVHAGKLWVICLHDLPVRLYKHDAGTGAKEAFELEVTSTPGRLAMAGDVLGVGGRVSFAINTLDDTVIGSFSIPLDNPSQVQPPSASLITPTRFVAGGFDWTAYYDLI